MSRARAAAPLARRVLRHFWFKALGTTAYTWVFFTAYFRLLRHPLGAVTVMPLTPLDHWIAFEPWALPIYLSLWLYVSLPVALMQRRRDVAAFGLRIAVPCLIGLAVFALWPSAVPSAHLDWARYPAVAWLKHADSAGNACPSLHVACAVFAAYWLHRQLGEFGAPAPARALNWLWCGAIAYSTIAVRQHVAVDVLAGALLGGGCAWLTRPRAARTPLRSCRR